MVIFIFNQMKYNFFIAFFASLTLGSNVFAQSEILQFKRLSINLKHTQIELDTSVFNILTHGKALVRTEQPFQDGDVFVLIDQKTQSRRQIKLGGTSSSGYKITQSSDWAKINHKEVLKPNPATGETYSISYGSETKIISGFDCKQLTLIYGNDSINVWYTEAIAYNWLFDNIFSLVPGTVIKAYNSKTTLLELISRNQVENIITEPEYSFILKNWNTNN